jgi:hypothetical protein
MTITFEELQRVYQEAKKIYSSIISWKSKYDLIFSDNISAKISFNWYAPETSYEEDVSAFMKGFHEYMNES